MLVAACGTTPPAGTQGAGATPAGGAGATPAPGLGGTAGAVATQSGGGGGFTGGPCALLTTAELAGVVGGSGWTTQEFPMTNGQGQCLYSSTDGGIAAISITTGAGVESIWSAFAGNATDVETVPGIGDRAIFLKSTEGMFFTKGATLVGITAGTGADGYDKRLDDAKALAGFIVARL